MVNMAKGVLNRYALEENGITFNREVVGSTGLRKILGKQAEILATRLLDFRRFAPQERAKTLCCYAQKIVVASESRWMDFVKTLFEPMITRARNFEGATTIGIREFEKSLRVDAGGDYIWDAADSVRSATAPWDAQMLTRPKPDLFISLPTIQAHRAPRGFAREPVLGTFRADRLQLLEETRGVVSSPLKLIGDRIVEAKDCLCFPCVVLEAKHHKVSQAEVEKCHCQAANGAASALALLNNLTIDCLESGVKTDMRPVVIITLNGQRTRLWIAGIKQRRILQGDDSNDRDYDVREWTRHMQCIWKGDVHFEESMMELICIIDSLEKWIIDDFRPWVSGNLDRHYREMDLEVEYYGAGDYSSDEEEASNDREYSASETCEEYEATEDGETDEEEKKWDKDWIVPESEDSESELDSDNEDYDEYVQDLARADSLMAELSLNDSARLARGVHRFIEVRRELEV
ncbi:uncharacterized protein ATNIH1004_000498 [Aspergillus tanneri]|uniref:Uncharacterized protein n=1 Tax=Aspergillus tanneri TaxID=1220188 RepID=A0A5M9MXK5_9EURO|nr:uncharacterized protein ATNIH1004_000498 [Aspergillus tanneri]KAA8651608.1 hypothetical protein ATNIH1004_000498 [Aspergillus tanneri]